MPGEKTSRDAEFTAFVVAHSAELLRIAWYLTGDVHRANELVQAALVKTYVGWLRLGSAQPLAYTRTAMANHRTDTWRRTRREILLDKPMEADTRSAVDEVERADTAHALIAALRSLPERQRQVVVLRYYCDLSERTVAAELGISSSAVKSAASRGLANLLKHYVEVEE